MKRSLLAFTLLLVATGLFLEFWDSPPAQFLKNKTAVTSTPKASAYMRTTETKLFAEHGTLKTFLTSNRIDVYRKQGYYELTKPDIINYLPDQPPWHLSADSGTLTSRKASEIILTGHVYLWKKLAAGGMQELKTTKMTFFPDKKFAETDKQVTLITPTERITAIGINADLEKQNYKLLANVKGTLNAN